MIRVDNLKTSCFAILIKSLEYHDCIPPYHPMTNGLVKRMNSKETTKTGKMN